MKIILDERETALYDKCASTISYTLNKPGNPTVQLSKRVLHLGDALITSDDDKELIIVERKSLQDLLASIKDGRYEEQSYRLIHSSGHLPHHIVYVIEGIMNQLKSFAEKKMVYSAITSLNMFKGFSVIRTSSVQETAEWIALTTDKIGRELGKGRTLWKYNTLSETCIENIVVNQSNGVDSQDIKNSIVSTQVVEQHPVSYCNFVKKVKKDNITPENWGEIVLCQIPGISSVSAIAIMKKFQSISHLIQVVKENPDCLDEIVCVSSGNKLRKLGKNVKQNVISFLLYSGVSENENP
jgi:ERCC4-type nuclease